MKLSVWYVALFMGVVVVARPEGEASPVTAPVTGSDATAADPSPVEEPAEEEESLRPKRWYYYPGGPYGPIYGSGFGYGYGPSFGQPFNSFNDMAHLGSFGTPVVSNGPIQGRTRYGQPRYRTRASFNELVNHQRHQEQAWQHQQWQRDQYVRNNFPDVVDTAAMGNTPFHQGFNHNNFNNRPFNQGFNNNNRPFNNNNFNNRPFNNNNFNNRPFNNFDNRPEVIDTQTPEGRTRLHQSMAHSASGPVPVFPHGQQAFAHGQGWQGGWNPNFHHNPGYF